MLKSGDANVQARGQREIHHVQDEHHRPAQIEDLMNEVEVPLDDAQPDEIEAIERGREQFARGDFVRLEDLQRELGLPIKAVERAPIGAQLCPPASVKCCRPNRP